MPRLSNSKIEALLAEKDEPGDQLAEAHTDDDDEEESSGGSDPEARILRLEPTRFPGGIAIWGALPAVYDTTNCPPDQGVHVHARIQVGGRKSIDETFAAVEVTIAPSEDTQEVFCIDGDDASHYNIATILKRRLKYLKCQQQR